MCSFQLYTTPSIFYKVHYNLEKSLEVNCYKNNLYLEDHAHILQIIVGQTLASMHALISISMSQHHQLHSSLDALMLPLPVPHLLLL
ncbi:hypothetical protein ACJX0J_026330, partial [Zea mays]